LKPSVKVIGYHSSMSYLYPERFNRALRHLIAGLVLASGATCGPLVHAQSQALLDPRVTPENIQSTICTRHYIERVAPSIDEAMRTKAVMLAQKGIPPSAAPDYTLQWRVPMLLGGSAVSSANLEVRKWNGEDGARRRSILAVRLHEAVCEDKVGLREAQAAIYNDWQGAFKMYVHGPALE
jgi:hypothetical protein